MFGCRSECMCMRVEVMMDLQSTIAHARRCSKKECPLIGHIAHPSDADTSSTVFPLAISPVIIEYGDDIAADMAKDLNRGIILSLICCKQSCSFVTSKQARLTSCRKCPPKFCG